MQKLPSGSLNMQYSHTSTGRLRFNSQPSHTEENGQSLDEPGAGISHTNLVPLIKLN